MSHAFVYGTLIAEPIVKALLRRVPEQKSAALHDFTRLRLKGRAFPAIVPCEGACVHGKVRRRNGGGLRGEENERPCSCKGEGG